jgi:hypothetical protein
MVLQDISNEKLGEIVRESPLFQILLDMEKKEKISAKNPE